MSDLFARAGWRVVAARPDEQADFIVQRGKRVYVVQVKAASEGRADRLVPLWSQAWLQAQWHAGRGQSPLAVVVAPRISRRAAEQILAFAREHVPGAAVGVVDFAGLAAFSGPGLHELNRDGVLRARPGGAPAVAPGGHLFSDLNQWLLKVLLAPEMPANLLSAPRGRYASASQLARAANVSVMSASRLLRHLRQGGFLHESSRWLELVRHEELFRRWQAAAGRSPTEAPFRFLARGDAQAKLVRVVRDLDGCLGLFAAADALDLGLVHGVPPHVYVRRLEAARDVKGLVPAAPGEAPDLILRTARSPESVFRGAVERDSVRVCDMVQVWLDVAHHPARGAEQAEEIRRAALDPVIAAGEG